MWLALGVTLGQLGVAGGPRGLVSSNKWRREGPVLLSHPSQPQVMPQQMQPVRPCRLGGRCGCSVRLECPARSWLSPPRAPRQKKTVHPLDRMLAVPPLRGFSPLSPPLNSSLVHMTSPLTGFSPRQRPFYPTQENMTTSSVPVEGRATFT